MADEKQQVTEVSPNEDVALECGLIMPISAIDGCSAEHWAQVQSFMVDAISEIQSPKFVAKIVSEEADVGMILKRIVRNVYNSEIVVCDVSGKNANVMFELGMRMAFDKPVVIVKDDKTDYSFDTSVIEHLEYPRDLRYPSMVEFKKKLKAKVLSTYLKSIADGYESFLKSFGTFVVARLDEKKGSPAEAMLDMMKDMQTQISTIQKSISPRTKIKWDLSAIDPAILAQMNAPYDATATVKEGLLADLTKPVGARVAREYLEKEHSPEALIRRYGGNKS